ncbi:MAG: 5-methylthioadenosine/S-adenosylhomocysteine deaminase [Parcubacteria group bacterium LiPW_39]|nr:MAG: 5-methylthioadenosine/S-adenosylhomocysteine deaminase [Parcubacteria group bacterium LiPW_39]
MRQIIKNGAILVRAEKIADIGPTKKLEKKYVKTVKEVINGKNKVVLPGLINAHTHAAMTLLRGYADDMPLKEWLTKKIWPAEAKLKVNDNYRGSKIACQEMLASGTTAFNDMYWYQIGEIRAAKEIGLRHFAGILVIDTGLVNFGPAAIEKIYRKLKCQATQKIQVTLAPHSIYAVSKETLIWCKNFADKNNLLLHIHLSETEKEVKDCLRQQGCRPVEYLEKIGFLGHNVIVAHACWLNDKEIKILAKKGVNIAHCPTSNLKLASGVMPFSKLIEAGVNVCLGTDGAASNNSLDMFWEMKMAALIHKWNEKNPEAANAQTILDLATINGAKSLKMEKEIGSLEVDKKADLIIINFDQPHLKPCFNPISHLIYAAKGADVETVIIGGQVLLKNQKFL